jgi:hypothetical protein
MLLSVDVAGVAVGFVVAVVVAVGATVGAAVAVGVAVGTLLAAGLGLVVAGDVQPLIDTRTSAPIKSNGSAYLSGGFNCIMFMQEAMVGLIIPILFSMTTT